MLIQPLGGAFGRVAEGATAFSHRGARWCYHALSQWPDPADTARNVAWTEEFVAAMAPYARREAHPNYVSDDRQDRVRSFYGGATYERLVAVKDRWDPESFCHNQNIRPRGASS